MPKVNLICTQCGKQFEVWPSRRKNTKRVFCSKQCQFLGQKGKNHPRYIGLTNRCIQCDRSFITNKYRVKMGWAKYCSKECFDNSQRERIIAPRTEAKCKQCGQIFKVKTSRLKYNPNHNQFCSRRCRYDSQKVPKVERVCEQCNRSFAVFPSAIRYSGSRFCSNKCKNDYNIGKHNVRFKNASNEMEKLRKSPAYKSWRTSVFIRDNRKCVWCGSTENIEADHIKPRYLFPELTLELSNGRTLCNPCHRKTPSYMNGYEKREDYL